MKKEASTAIDGPATFEAEESARIRAARLRQLEWAGLGFILAVATAIRFSGITWGLPNKQHWFSYHPDETVILFHSLPAFGSLNVFSTEWFKYVLPHFYNYGSLQLYLINILSSFANAYNLIGPIFLRDGDLDVVHVGQFYLLGRCLTAVMGVCTVWAVYATAKRLWGVAAGVWAALILAVMPLHIQHSHFMTVDVPATLWVTLSLYWSARVLKDEGLFAKTVPVASAEDMPDKPVPLYSRRANPWVMAGLFAGLAMATKYNAALVLLPLLVAGHYRRVDDLTGAVKGTVSGILAFVIAFILGCPGAIFESNKFLADVRYESNHVYRHGEPAFQHTGLGWVYIVTHNLSAGMGWPLLILTIIAVGFAVWRRRPEDLLLLAFALPYYILVGAAQSRYARYEIPLLPVLAMWLGAFAYAAYCGRSNGSSVNIIRVADANSGIRDLCVFGIRHSAVRNGAIVVCVLAAWWTATLSAELIAPMTRTDPRDLAVAQYGSDRTKTFGFATIPWFYTPPLNPMFCLPGPGQWLSREHRWDYQHLVIDRDAKPFDTDYLRSSKPDIVFLSEFEYAAPLRLGDMDARDYIAELRRDYDGPVTIGKPTEGVGLRYIDGLPVQSLPHDMLYTNPQTLVFVRKPPTPALRATPPDAGRG